MTTAPRRMRALLVAALLAACAAPLSAADLSQYDPKKITTPPIGKIPAVTPVRFTLANGVVVYLLENHELPVVSGTAYFPTSPDVVPADRAGLATLVGQVMRSGGSAAHSGDWLDDRLSAIGASLNANVSPTLANAGFRCLSDNTAEVVGLWAEMVRQPAFPDDKIELAKVGLRRSIASRNDEMLSVLFRSGSLAVYGKDSPWSRQAEYATVEPIAKADCQALHGRVFVPERMILAVYGDFRSAEMKSLLTARLGNWAKSGTPKPVLPPTPTSVTPKVVYAPKEDVTQSGIVVAQPGSRADDPDYAAMQVLEQGLGGGFSSRMFNHIRTQRGLAYAAGAQAGTDFQRPGVFMAYTLTRSESTMTALGLVRDEVRAVTQAPFTPAELDVAKQAVVNGFVFNFADPSQVLFRAAYYEAVGYPADFLQGYQKALDAVTANSVLEAARRKIHPDQVVAIVVGKESDFDRPLASAGLPVERLDLTIPPPPSKLAAVSASPASGQKAKAWLDAAVKAAGGSAAWAAVKGYTATTEMTVSMQGQTINLSGEESWSLPNRMTVKQTTPMGDIRQGFDGKSGWASRMGQVMDDPRAAQDIPARYERSLWRIFAHPEQVELVALDAPETIEGTAYNVAAVRGAQSHDLVLLFAPDGKLGGIAYQSEGGPAGAARTVSLYSGWAAEGAIQYPHATKVLRDGQPFADSKLTSLKLNPALADAMFQKPAN